MPREVIVLKFGGSVLRNEGDLPGAVSEIYRWRRRGFGVVAVVSAFEGETDSLLGRARGFDEKPEPFALAALVATGERTSAATLGLALDRVGLPACVLDEAGAGLRASGAPLDAALTGAEVDRLREHIEETGVLVIPGFLGRDERGRVVLLGRGGSDYSALFIAAKLGARCRLVKDVPGLFDRDPAVDANARLYRSLHWDDALRLDGRIVQHKGVRFAREAGLNFQVGKINGHQVTQVGRCETRFVEGEDEAARVAPLGLEEDDAAAPVGLRPRQGTDAPLGRRARDTDAPRGRRPIPPPLRVGLLGAGTVGLRVYQALEARPELFEVVGVAVRNREKAIANGVRGELITCDPWKVLERRCDVIVEALGGVAPAADVLEAALEQGLHVVTANKTVVSREWDRLARARKRGVGSLRYSASVGGGVPVIETVAARAKGSTDFLAEPRKSVARNSVEGCASIKSIEAVLNGTTTFVLDRVGTGSTFEEAVAEAQRLGFAEANPSKDIDGIDAAEKVAILARVGFGVVIDPDEIECRGIAGLNWEEVRKSYAAGKKWRLVAKLGRVAGSDAPVAPLSTRCARSAQRTGVTATTGLVARIEAREVEGDSVFGTVTGAGNAAVVRGVSGEEVVRGKGAGAWPTAEAVLADLLQIARSSGRSEIRGKGNPRESVFAGGRHDSGHGSASRATSNGSTRPRAKEVVS